MPGLRREGFYVQEDRIIKIYILVSLLLIHGKVILPSGLDQQ